MIILHVKHFGLSALGKIKFLVQIRIVRAQVRLSRKKTCHQNYIAVISVYLYGAALKRDTRPAMLEEEGERESQESGLATKTPCPEVQVLTHSPRPWQASHRKAPRPGRGYMCP
ncbi:hypothetical protein TNCV_2228281 [Trichonephila clavipes]|nr:hypothetical protein TNCV_2228281 [Trichonephila clavipes]